MIVFGDSLSDNGNLSLSVGSGLFAAQNYDPFRVTDGPTTTPATSISGVMVEQLNTLLGLPSLAPVVAGGSNYAWAYAKTDFSTFDPVHLVTPGTGAQIATYLATHPTASPNSLYVLWAGANDLGDATSLTGIQDAETAAISNLQLELGALLSAGARNILWLNLPDLSLTPGAAALPSLVKNQLHDSSAQFRSDWAGTLAQLKWLYPDAKVTGVDVYSILNNLVSDGASYGFTNVTDSARGKSGVNPDEYVFWDDLHPTTRADQILAQAVFQQLEPVPEASGSVYLSFALLGLVAHRLFGKRRRAAGRCDAVDV